MDLFDDDDEEGKSDILSSAEFLSQRPSAADVICFHKGTEDILLRYVEENSIKGDVDGILQCIDRFCYSRHWMMHLGDQKSHYLVEAVASAREKCPDSLICLELGSYCGYSTTLIANQLSSTSKLISIELDPRCCAWTNRLVAHATVQDRVHLIQGSLEDGSTRDLLKQALGNMNASIGLVFIDHDKARYKNDLLILEDMNLLNHGCIVVADNIMCFGEPSQEYLAHVRDPSGPFASSVCHECFIEYTMPPSTDHIFTEDDAVQRAKLNNPAINSLRDGIEISIYR
jgi:catechol O-methyltransferase